MASKENNIDSSNKDNSNDNIDNNIINNDGSNGEVIMKMIELEQDSKRFMIWNVIPGVR